MGDVDLQELLFTASGRVNRGKWWGVNIIGWLAFIAIAAVGALIGDVIGALALMVGYVAYLWATIAVSIKRWHDRGKSGWFYLVAFIPLVGWLWFLVECGFLPGTPGPNEYGPDPLAG
jgi:uncharacterized membrane protein YhaH (DUF805 family)